MRGIFTAFVNTSFIDHVSKGYMHSKFLSCAFNLWVFHFIDSICLLEEGYVCFYDIELSPLIAIPVYR